MTEDELEACRRDLLARDERIEKLRGSEAFDSPEQLHEVLPPPQLVHDLCEAVIDSCMQKMANSGSTRLVQNHRDMAVSVHQLLVAHAEYGVPIPPILAEAMSYVSGLRRSDGKYVASNSHAHFWRLFPPRLAGNAKRFYAAVEFVRTEMESTGERPTLEAIRRYVGPDDKGQWLKDETLRNWLKKPTFRTRAGLE